MWKVTVFSIIYAETHSDHIKMTQTEKQALLVLTGLMVLSFLIQWAKPHLFKPEVYDYSLEDSLFNALSVDTTALKQQSGPYTDNHSHEKPEINPGRPVNINTAGHKELQQLPGIGPATAERIVTYRETHGPFASPEELTRVKRIGPKTLERIKPMIFVQTDRSQ